MERLTTSFLKIFDDPLVFCIASGLTLKSGFDLCLQAAGSKPFHVIVVPYWNVADQADELEIFSRKIESKLQNIKAHFLCPSEADRDLLLRKSLSAIHAHHNAFIDDRVFKPNPQIQKIYRAVHNAALVAFKRHYLAWRVENIAVITYRHIKEDSLSHLAGYRSLTWSNLSEINEIQYASSDEVAKVICQSNVGLILSAKEGGNFASGEYQFCGIPTITTRSLGGRAEFLNAGTTTTVWPYAWAVNRAVAYWEKRLPDPNEIRRETMAKAILHRMRLLDLLKKITGQNVHAMADANGWLPGYRDKLRERVELEEDRYLPFS